MKSSTNENNKVAQPTVDFRKIPYDKGSEWTTEWFEDFARFVRMIPENLLKKQMVSVLDKGVNYTPKFRTLDEVMTDYDITDLEQGKVVENALSKAVSQETINLPLVRSQSHAIIVHLLEECAKAVASADPIFRMNDELANPDPVATVLALKRILIAEREGNGSVRKMTSKAEAIADFLAIRKNSTSNENEGLTDFRDRFVRKQKGLKDNYGYEILGNTFADEREMVLFFTHRLDSKYVQLQRDIKNKIVPAPLTLDEAVLMAKDRVEVTKNALETVAPVSIFTTVVRGIPATNLGTKTSGPSVRNTSGHVKRADHKKGFQKLGPLVPYPYLSNLEYSALTELQKSHIKEHNRAIKNAGDTMRKDVANNRAGRATMVTTATDELEELDVGLVMMSYDHPQESEPMPTEEPPYSEEDPGEIVLLQLVAEHEIVDEQNRGFDNTRDPQSYPKRPRQPERHNREYNLIKIPHSIFDSTNVEPSYWYCIGGRGNGEIRNNYVLASDRVTGTFVYPSGYAHGFQSLEAAQLCRTEVTRKLVTIMKGREEYMIYAFTEGNMIKIQLYPPIFPVHAQHTKEVTIYNTFPTSEDEYHADRLLLDTHAQGGGTIPTDVDEYRALLVQLRSTPTGVHTMGATHISQSPQEFREYPSVTEEMRANNRGANNMYVTVTNITPSDSSAGDIGSDNLPLPTTGPHYHPRWPTTNIVPPVEEDNTPRHHLLNDYAGGGPPQLHLLGAILDEGGSPDPLNRAYLTRTLPGVTTNDHDNDPEDIPPPVRPTRPVTPQDRPYRTPPNTTGEPMGE